MRLFSSGKDEWTKDTNELKNSSDADDRKHGWERDKCLNNPRHGGHGYFGYSSNVDRRR